MLNFSVKSNKLGSDLLELEITYAINMGNELLAREFLWFAQQEN